MIVHPPNHKTFHHQHRPLIGPHNTTDKSTCGLHFMMPLCDEFSVSPTMIFPKSELCSTYKFKFKWFNFVSSSITVFFLIEDLTDSVKPPWPTLQLVADKRNCSLCNRHWGGNLGESSSAMRRAELVNWLWKDCREHRKGATLFPHGGPGNKLNWKWKTWHIDIY